MRAETAKAFSRYALVFNLGIMVTVDTIYGYGFLSPLPLSVFILYTAGFSLMVGSFILWRYLIWAKPGVISIDTMSIGETQVSGKGWGHKTAITRLSEDEFEISHYHRNRVLWTKRVKAVNDELVMYDVQEVKRE